MKLMKKFLSIGRSTHHSKRHRYYIGMKNLKMELKTYKIKKNMTVTLNFKETKSLIMKY